MLKKVLVHARKSLKFATLLGIAAFLIIGLVAYFFKPTYRVILNNEQIGYTSDKGKLQAKINDYIKNGDGQNVAFVQVDLMPEYQLCLLKRGIVFNDDEIYEKVKNGMVHFGIVNQFDMTDHRDTALDITPLFGARLQIISSRNNHFSLPKEASIKSIEKFPFISFFPEYAVGSTISNYISKNNISLNTISYISSFNTLINMVKANIGISIIDSFAVKDDNDLCITNIIDEIPLRKYIMISKKNRYIPPQSIAFKELLFEFIPPKNCISLLP